MLLDLLAPPLCWACRAPAARGSALCRPCRGALRFLDGAGALSAAGRPGAQGLDEFLPHTGRKSSSPPATPVWAAVAYEGPARDLVKALKFRGAIRVADEMAALVAANAPPGVLDWPGLGECGAGLGEWGAARGEQAPALVPVPLHPARSRARGFNQAVLIARALARRTGLPVVDCLRRSGPAARQVGRDRAARLRGPAGSIDATGPAPSAAVLVDDVVTTGATLAACAAALRAAGATRVEAIAFARTAGR